MIEAIRAWARKHTEQRRYSPVGVAFHWIMAALVLFQLGWGWWIGRLPAGSEKLTGYQLHSDVGLLIVVLALGRFAWRTMIPGPINDADSQGWQSTIAHIIHWIFYICLFGLPLSGWAMWSALGDGEPLAVAGVIPWPQLPFHNLPVPLQWAVMNWAETIHQLLIVVLTALIPLHVAAALKHHFWDRHDVLEGMLPDIPDVEESREGRRHRPRPI